MKNNKNISVYTKIRREWNMRPVTKVKPNDKIYNRKNNKQQGWKKEASKQHEVKIKCVLLNQKVILSITAFNIQYVNIKNCIDIANELFELGKKIHNDILKIVKPFRTVKLNIDDIYIDANANMIEMKYRIFFEVYAGFDDKLKIIDMMKNKYNVKVEIS